MLIHRTYLFLHKRTPRALAAVAVAGTIAGCGSGGGSSTPAATPTPTPSGVAVGLGSTSVRGAGKITHGTVGSVGHGSGPSVSRSSTGSISHGNGGTVLSKQAAKQQQQQTTPAKTTPAKATTTTIPVHTTTTSPPVHTTPPPPVKTTPTKSTPTKTRPPAKHKKTVKTKIPPTRTTVKTVTKTKTVVHTVTKTVRPNVPAGAFLPSRNAVLAQPLFTVSGSNVTCQITYRSVRCGIIRRVWAAPVQPATCRGVWGDTISLARQGLPQFVCGGNNPPADAKVIPVGYDDTVGIFTCEVRSFGVNCFSSSRSGFLLSRTGYAFY